MELRPAAFARFYVPRGHPVVQFHRNFAQHAADVYTYYKI